MRKSRLEDGIRGLQRLAAPLGFGFVVITLGWAAYRSGLFFDSDLYGLARMLFIGGLLWALFVPIRGRTLDVMPGMIFPLSLSALYALTLLANPVSVQGSTDAALRWLAYACWAMLLAAIWRKESNRQWGKAAIQATGVFVLVSGWLGWFGAYAHPEIVLRFNDPELSATGTRLAGFFQYPNAYGALLATFLLMQLQAWTAVDSKRWQSRLAAWTAVFYGGALLLTESRGAYAALVLGLAIAFGSAKAGSRVKWVLAVSMTAAGSTLLALLAWHWMPSAEGGGAHPSCAGMVGVTVCGLLGGAAFARVRGRLTAGEGKAAKGPLPRWLPWATSLIGAAALCWLWISSEGERLSGHFQTAASRWLFYKDAWGMFLDRPWLGFGGDSWREMLGLYQSEPYVGNEVHSGYLSLILDTGIVGLALMLVMFGFGVRTLWRKEKAAIAPAALLLVHALIDFDWSYAFVWLLLIAWFQVHAGGRGNARDAGAVGHSIDASHTWSTAGVLVPRKMRSPGVWTRRLGCACLPALLAAGAAAGLWAASRSDAAATAYGNAAIAASPEARAAHLRAALEANPAYAGIRLGLAPLLPLRERASLLAAGLRYEPQSAPLHLQLGIAYAELGDVAQASDSLREAVRLDRFSREGQTAALAAMANLAAFRQEAGDANAANEAAAAGAAFYARYRELARQVAAMKHPANDRQFALTIAANFHAARCLLILNRRDEADVLLREIVRLDDGDWRERALKLLDE
ncbi:O-antigen ligase family protein [Cohnella yongneupensis]|uniref:O-antigen ligase family protein n=1 Tax=Cohnella yongneupensis TaxID=425006 RepID=A0ABW0R0Z1_9BACL